MTLKDVAITLAPITVLVGANNVGKTNVVRALDLIGATAREGDFFKALELLGGRNNLARRGSSEPIVITIEGKSGAYDLRYSVSTIGSESFIARGPISGSWDISPGSKDGMIPWVNARLIGAVPGQILPLIRERAETPEDVRKFVQFLQGLTVADFSPGRLREPSTISADAHLGHQGENLAAVLDRLSGETPIVRRKIDEEVHRAVPSIDQVTTIPIDQPGMKVIGVAEGNNVYRADLISDGILLFVALSTVAQMSGGSTLVAIEELEKGIHPRRIRECLDQILRMSRSGSQFVLTTHSPILLSEFRDAPESVIVLERDEGSGTRATRLVDLPVAVAQLGEVSLGDLWYSGVLGGVPNP